MCIAEPVNGRTRTAADDPAGHIQSSGIVNSYAFIRADSEIAASDSESAVIINDMLPLQCAVPINLAVAVILVFRAGADRQISALFYSYHRTGAFIPICSSAQTKCHITGDCERGASAYPGL